MATLTRQLCHEAADRIAELEALIVDYEYIKELEAEVERLREAAAEQGERRYPCEKCGRLRTKAEGGTTFTVCDDCWPAATEQEKDDD